MIARDVLDTLQGAVIGAGNWITYDQGGGAYDTRMIVARDGEDVFEVVVPTLSGAREYVRVTRSQLLGVGETSEQAVAMKDRAMTEPVYRVVAIHLNGWQDIHMHMTLVDARARAESVGQRDDVKRIEIKPM